MIPSTKEVEAGQVDVMLEARRPYNPFPIFRANCEAHFEVVKDLSPTQRNSINNYMIGWLSGIVSEEKWIEALENAERAIKVSKAVTTTAQVGAQAEEKR